MAPWTYHCSCGNSWGTNRVGPNTALKCRQCGDRCFPTTDDSPLSYHCDDCGKIWISRSGGPNRCYNCGNYVDPRPAQKDEFAASPGAAGCWEDELDDDGYRPRRPRSRHHNPRPTSPSSKNHQRPKTQPNTSKINAQMEETLKNQKKLEEEVARLKEQLRKQEEDAKKKERESLAREQRLAEEQKRMQQENSRRMKEMHDRAEEQKRMEKDNVRRIEEMRRRREAMDKRDNEEKLKRAQNKNKQDSVDEAMGNNLRGFSRNPHDDEARRSRAEQEKKDSEARRKITEAEKKKEVGNDHFRNGRYEQAVEMYTAAIGLEKTTASYYSNRCVALMKLDKYQEALGDANKTIALDPSSTKAHLCYVKCLLAMGEGELAERACEELIKLAPNDTAAKDQEKQAKEIRTLASSAQSEMKRGVYNSALNKVNQLLSKSHQSQRFKAMKAELLVQLRRYEEAEQQISDIKTSHGEGPDLLYIRGLSAYNQNQLEMAKEHFRRVVALAPDHSQAAKFYKTAKRLHEVSKTAFELLNAKEDNEAYDKFTEALKIDPKNHLTNARMYLRRAQCAKKLNKLRLAIEDCTKAIDLDENYSASYVLRGQCYMAKYRYEDAMNDLEIAIDLNDALATQELLQKATEKFEQEERNKPKDYYKILDVTKTSSPAELKKAYHKLARVHHPDRHSSGSAQKKRQEERKFKLISEAYNTLSDRVKKRDYDLGRSN